MAIIHFVAEQRELSGANALAIANHRMACAIPLINRSLPIIVLTFESNTPCFHSITAEQVHAVRLSAMVSHGVNGFVSAA